MPRVNNALMLAIETSSARGSVALGLGDDLIAHRALSAERKHTPELLPAMRDLLTEAGYSPADVGVLCFSRGPGSFTGLRVAAVVAQMWQSTVGSHVVCVPTLEVIARNAPVQADVPRRLAVMLDARRGEVFGAVFARENGAGLRTVADAARHEVKAWLAGLHRPCALLGDGLTQHRQLVLAMGLIALPESCWWPDARQVLAVGRRLAADGRFCTPAEIVPAYLRPPECEEVYEQRRAEARARRAE
jgi:tRNA threonylcarbamoyladenosine biosynthesis protein TsaB